MNENRLNYVHWNYAKGPWRSPMKRVSRTAMWSPYSADKQFFANMPIKVKLFHKVHLMYAHDGSDALHWKRAGKRLEQHLACLPFQTDWC